MLAIMMTNHCKVEPVEEKMKYRLKKASDFDGNPVKS